MVQVDLPGAFAAGQMFALLSGPYLRARREERGVATTAPVLAYLTLIYAPVGMFLLVGWPAWEGMYWWDWIEQPAFKPLIALFYIGFHAAMVLIGIGSYRLGVSLYVGGRDKAVRWLAIIGLVATLLPFFLWPLTWIHVGTYAEYHAVPRQTYGFLDMRFFVPWLCIMSYLTIGTAAFSFWLWRRSLALAGKQQRESTAPAIALAH